MTTNFEFVDELPEGGGGGSRGRTPILRRFAEALRANPRKWAKYPFEFSSPGAAFSTASRINTGKNGCARSLIDPEFQAQARGCVVYVRFFDGDDRAVPAK